VTFVLYDGFWKHRYARTFAIGFVIATGVLLCAVRNIHGAALLAGLAIAFAVQRPAVPGASDATGSGDAGKLPASDRSRRYAHR
jgi:hypothetical protein